MSFASSILGKLPVQVSFLALLLAHTRLRFEVLGCVPASRVHVVGVEASSSWRPNMFQVAITDRTAMPRGILDANIPVIVECFAIHLPAGLILNLLPRLGLARWAL